MRITAVKPIVVNAGRNHLFVKVETDEGVWGIGECGLTYHYAACREAVNALTVDLVGEDPMRVEHLWQVMFRGSFFPGGRVLSAAISAIDIALWDIRGKALGVPVYTLLGGPCRSRVACYTHMHGDDVETVVQRCREAVQQGWRHLRISLPDPHAERGLFDATRAVRFSVEQFEALRAEFGDEVELCIDLHTRLDLSEAAWLCRELERFRPYFVEDPLRSENAAAYRSLRQLTAAPLAVGEQHASKWELRELIDEDLINYCRMDLCLVGGITEARKVAGWCETHYIRLAPHNPLGPVSTAACLHLDLATPLFGVQEVGLDHDLLPDVFQPSHRLEGGNLIPADEPGLGVDFNEEAAAEHPPRPYKHPRMRRDDDSFTNW